MKRLLLAAAVLFASERAPASAFINLDFELVQTTDLTPMSVADPGAGWYGSVAALLPGWRLLDGGSEAERITYDLNTGGLRFEPISIIPRFSRYDSPRFVRGDFGLRMETITSDGRNGSTFSLTQLGDIPSDAKYLQFDAATFGGFSLYVDGVKPLQVTGSEISFRPKLMTYDISPFAGRNVELRFELRNENGQAGDFIFFDSIRFAPIPEPSTFALLTLGGAFLLAWRNRDRSKI